MLTWGRVVISLSAALRMEPRDELLAISSWSELV